MKTILGWFKGRPVYLLDSQEDDERIIPFLNRMFGTDTEDNLNYHFLICESPNGELVATYRYALERSISQSNTDKYYIFSGEYERFIRPRALQLGRTAADSADHLSLYAILKAGVGPCIYHHMKNDGVIYITGQPTLQDKFFSHEAQCAIYSLFFQSFGAESLFMPREPAFNVEDLTQTYKFSPYHNGGKDELAQILFSLGCKRKPTLFYFYADLVDKGIRVGLPVENKQLEGTEMFVCVNAMDFPESKKVEFFGPDYAKDMMITN